MRLPDEVNKYKSDGRTIQLDLNDHIVADIATEPDAAAIPFADWLRSHGWTVNTQHQGAMQIGGKTADQDKDVFNLQLRLLNEYAGAHLIH